jgi:XTP/dITP diphosphohydrolase
LSVKGERRKNFRCIFYTFFSYVKAIEKVARVLDRLPHVIVRFLTIMAMKLLVASSNQGKIAEFAGLLEHLPFELLGLRDIIAVPDVEETGATFEENAVLKAREYAVHSGIWTLADDSGLEVEALGGRPGVHSARYGGENTSFREKIGMLLDELAKAANPSRRARFVSVIAIADGQGRIRYVAEGTITDGPRGENGFGYDPVFIPEGFAQTFGELSGDVKRQISHRARASAKIIQYLRDFTGD